MYMTITYVFVSLSNIDSLSTFFELMRYSAAKYVFVTDLECLHKYILEIIPLVI